MFLSYNTVINSDLNQCDKLIPNLDNQMKFPPILEIQVAEHNLEYYIFCKLIQSSISFMKSISLHFYNISISPEQCKRLTKCIESSKIQFLELSAWDNVTVKSPEFCDFIKNSIYLKIFKLKTQYLNTNEYNLFFESLKFNQSIQILIVDGPGSSEFSTVLKNLIMFNSSITSLVISVNDIVIDEGFIKAILKNKSLKYLFLWVYPQKDETVLKLFESNLKGINIKERAISQEAMNLIHSKIPRIKYSDELQYYEKFLK